MKDKGFRPMKPERDDKYEQETNIRVVHTKEKNGYIYMYLMRKQTATIDEKIL